jgi:signal peptidase II
MPAKQILRTIIILLIIFTNISCDQFTKKMVREIIVQHATISLLSDHITVTNVENSGAFLSTGSSLPGNTKYFLLSLLPLSVLIVGLIYILTKHTLSPPLLFGLCFVLGGGIGNIFDRMVYGSVTDFLHISFGSVQTGIFNMADVSIMTGAAIILIHSLFKRIN